MYSRAVGGILLIAGTCIGAGALALPLVTANAGFIASLVLFVVCWAFMTASALLMLEVALAITTSCDLVTMAQKTIGSWGKVLAWTTYLLLLYALTALYITGGAPWVNFGISVGFGDINNASMISAIIFTAALALIVLWGTRHADTLNRILMLGLAIVYGIIVFVGIKKIEPSYLNRAEFNSLVYIIPVIVTTFGYHVVIPALTDYVGRNRNQLIKSILIGSLIPLFLYILWEIIVLGVIPAAGDKGLLALAASKATPDELALALDHHLEYTQDDILLPLSTKLFSLFAIVTSFLGVSVSLFHFLRDGLRGVSFFSKPTLGLLTFVPPLIIATLYPRGFTFILGFAGIFVAVLLGILPALMAWYGRYKTQIITNPIVPGGKLVLLIIILAFAAVIPIEIYEIINN